MHQIQALYISDILLHALWQLQHSTFEKLSTGEEQLLCLQQSEFYEDLPAPSLVWSSYAFIIIQRFYSYYLMLNTGM